jgi:hypothetical protein
MLVAPKVEHAFQRPRLLERVMSKKPRFEADLDPAGTRHTRPGAKIAESALANASRPRKRKARPGASSPTRPGATAAARAVDATRRKATRK